MYNNECGDGTQTMFLVPRNKHQETAQAYNKGMSGHNFELAMAICHKLKEDNKVLINAIQELRAIRKQEYTKSVQRKNWPRRTLKSVDLENTLVSNQLFYPMNLADMIFEDDQTYKDES